jgi:riboflavin kinase/FMN adenylyltransferase
MAVSPTPSFTIVRDNADAGALKRAVIAIGNFDGVHRGHRAVIGKAIARARALSVPAAALTLEPHPRGYFRPNDPLFRLSDESQKLRLLAGSGLDGAIVLTFNAALANLPAGEFIERVLVDRFAVSGVVTGFDFHFGKDRGGSPAFLAAEGKARGFPVDIVPALEDEGRPVSSGTIRAALSAGRVVEAAELLGYPWFVSGEVIHGEKRGRDLGFPTANIRLDPGCGRLSEGAAKAGHPARLRPARRRHPLAQRKIPRRLLRERRRSVDPVFGCIGEKIVESDSG